MFLMRITFVMFLIFCKSRFSFFVDSFTSSTFEKREVSSAKILHIDVIPSGRSFM